MIRRLCESHKDQIVMAGKSGDFELSEKVRIRAREPLEEEVEME